ncbi:MAG: hypothetical protein HOP13_17705 [Alphaproteobacteria bacterium]|nr:hypothetical protein [Alphaproteobacteria bacterium]
MNVDTRQSGKLVRLLRASALLSHAAKIAALALLVANAAMWLVPEFAAEAVRSQAAIGKSPVTLTFGARAAALVVSTAYVGLMALALWTVASLFASFAAGAIFVPATGTRLRRLGVLLLLFATLSPVFRAIVGVIVTLGNEGGQRILAFSISSQDIIVALVAALLIALGHIMAEAARIADDNRQIV